VKHCRPAGMGERLDDHHGVPRIVLEEENVDTVPGLAEDLVISVDRQVSRRQTTLASPVPLPMQPAAGPARPGEQLGTRAAPGSGTTSLPAAATSTHAATSARSPGQRARTLSRWSPTPHGAVGGPPFGDVLAPALPRARCSLLASSAQPRHLLSCGTMALCLAGASLRTRFRDRTVARITRKQADTEAGAGRVQACPQS
jgi:hypothetical protein